MRDILTALGAMIGAFVFGVVAITVAAFVTLVIVAIMAGTCWGNIERSGVIVTDFDQLGVNDVYDAHPDNGKLFHTYRQVLGLRNGDPMVVERSVLTKLNALVRKRGDYYILIWTERWTGRIHLWRAPIRSQIDSEWDLLEDYECLTPQVKAHDWYIHYPGLTPARGGPR